jgi:sulfite reductase alpha subunit-like flavoprotein
MFCTYIYFQLEKEELVLFIASTFGSGDPPSNGVPFKSQLDSEPLRLSRVRYAVFGLGSTLYLKIIDD